jgi:hypothetical protein
MSPVECSRVQQVVSMSLLMQVRSGEPKLFDSGTAWGDNEGPTQRQQMVQLPGPLTVARRCFCGRMASQMRDAIDQAQRCAKRNSRLTAGVPRDLTGGRPVGVDDAKPRCSAQSRARGPEGTDGRASCPCKPPQTASGPPCLLLPTTPEDIPSPSAHSHHFCV